MLRVVVAEARAHHTLVLNLSLKATTTARAAGVGGERGVAVDGHGHGAKVEEAPSEVNGDSKSSRCW